MANVSLDLQYTKAQYEIFFNTHERFKCFPKGRRLGFTRGGAQAMIEWMLEEDDKYLWGDTVLSNINKYVERYFLPVLKQLPRDMYDWRKTEKMLVVGESQLDFRSADHPENWEGFGYRKVVLNEAGIILENEYLWENAVQPMLLDNPKSEAFIGGTPKGENLFHKLAQRGYSKAYPDWATRQYSTYDNPFISEDEITRMAADMDETVMRQEIFGEFVGDAERQMISASVVDEAIERVLPDEAWAHAPIVFGVDVAREGDDQTVIAIRQGLKLHPLIKYSKMRTDTTAGIVAGLIKKHRPARVFVDSTGGFGAGVVDHLLRYGHGEILHPIHFAEKASEPKLYANIRFEMWKNLRDWLYTGALPRDNGMRSSLLAPRYTWDEQDREKLEKKEKTKARLGRSPDEGDAIALTVARPVLESIPRNSLIPEYAGDY